MSGSFTKWWMGFASIMILQITLFAQSGVNTIGSFEQPLPSYWTMGSEPTGATLTWATDQFRSMGKSLKIEKAVTSDSAMWESENMVDLWSERYIPNVDINFGQYYMTSGVNTNPTSDDQRWYITWTFYKGDGSVIGVKKFNIDQSVASTSGWVADTTAVGEISLPDSAYKAIIRFIGGKNATGTVWTDDYIFFGRGNWAGQDWNTAVGVPTGWFYWLPPIGGNDGILNDGYENTIVTNEFAYDGLYSLKFDIPHGTHDGFVGTKRYALGDIQPGDSILVSVWVKGANLYPDSAIIVGDQWSVSLTTIYHTTINNNDGWGQYAASPDIPLVFPSATSFDWTQFYVGLTVPEPPAGDTAKSISVRLHPLGRFSGTVWMDLLEVQKAPTGVVQNNHLLPADYNLFQNYPNPFNPTTTIGYSLPKVSYVTLKIYDLLGREVKTLVSTEQNGGLHRVQWNGLNNYGSKVASGIYLYRIEAGDFNVTKKMILLK